MSNERGMRTVTYYALASWWYETTGRMDVTTPTAELAWRGTVFVGPIAVIIKQLRSKYVVCMSSSAEGLYLLTVVAAVYTISGQAGCPSTSLQSTPCPARPDS